MSEVKRAKVVLSGPFFNDEPTKVISNDQNRDQNGILLTDYDNIQEQFDIGTINVSFHQLANKHIHTDVYASGSKKNFEFITQTPIDTYGSKFDVFSIKLSDSEFIYLAQRNGVSPFVDIEADSSSVNAEILQRSLDSKIPNSIIDYINVVYVKKEGNTIKESLISTCSSPVNIDMLNQMITSETLNKIGNIKIGTVDIINGTCTINIAFNNTLPNIISFFIAQPGGTGLENTRGTLNGHDNNSAFRWDINLPIDLSDYSNDTTLNSVGTDSLRCFLFLALYIQCANSQVTLNNREIINISEIFENTDILAIIKKYLNSSYDNFNADVPLINFPRIRQLMRSELLTYYRIFKVSTMDNPSMDFNMMDYSPLVFNKNGNKLSLHATALLRDTVTDTTYLLIPRFIYEINTAANPQKYYSFNYTKFNPYSIIWRPVKSHLTFKNDNFELEMKPAFTNGQLDSTLAELFDLTNPEVNEFVNEFFRNVLFYESNSAEDFTDGTDVSLMIKDNAGNYTTLSGNSVYSIFVMKSNNDKDGDFEVVDRNLYSKLAYNKRWLNFTNIVNTKLKDIQKFPRQFLFVKIGYSPLFASESTEKLIAIPMTRLNRHYCISYNQRNIESPQSKNMLNYYPLKNVRHEKLDFFTFDYFKKNATTLSDVLYGSLYRAPDISTIVERQNKVSAEYTGSAFTELIPRFNNRRSIWFGFKLKQATSVIDFAKTFDISKYNNLEDVQILDQYDLPFGQLMIFDNSGNLVLAVDNYRNCVPNNASFTLKANTQYYMVYEYCIQSYRSELYFDKHPVRGLSNKVKVYEQNSLFNLDDERSIFSEVSYFFSSDVVSTNQDNTKTLWTDPELTDFYDFESLQLNNIFLHNATRYKDLIDINEPFFTITKADDGLRFHIGAKATKDSNETFEGYKLSEEPDEIINYRNDLTIVEKYLIDNQSIKDSTILRNMFSGYAKLRDELCKKMLFEGMEFIVPDEATDSLDIENSLQAIAIISESEKLDLRYINIPLEELKGKSDIQFDFQVVGKPCNLLDSNKFTWDTADRTLYLFLILPRFGFSEINEVNSNFTEKFIKSIKLMNNDTIQAYTIIQ